MAGLDLNADEHPSTNAAIRDLVVLERVNPDDGNSAALFDGDAEYAVLLAINEDTNATGLFLLDGPDNNVTQFDGGSEWGASSTAQSNNLFHDGSDYVVENNTGTDDQSMTVVGFREV